MIPPCGVPVRLSSISPVWVITPALRNAFTSARTRLSFSRSRTRSMRAVWSIRSNEAPSYYPYRGLSFNREDHAAAASA
jgi:hypothetical protein